MKYACFLPVLVLISTVGCDQSHLIAPLEARNAELTTEVGELTTKTEKMEKGFAELESKWTSFERSYDAGQREELANNIAATALMVGEAAREAEASATLLKRLQELEAEVVTLRDQCRNHVAESADVNQVGQLKNAVSQVQSEVARLQTSASMNGDAAKNKLLRVEASVQSLKSDISRLKSEISRLRFRSRF
jgi:chromosome segregation ATPase